MDKSVMNLRIFKFLGTDLLLLNLDIKFRKKTSSNIKHNVDVIELYSRQKSLLIIIVILENILLTTSDFTKSTFILSQSSLEDSTRFL